MQKRQRCRFCHVKMKYDKEVKPFYRTAAWRRVRQLALIRDGAMCCECMRRMRDGSGTRVRRATMVHHIIPIDQRPDLALDLDNLESLCDSCHNREHPEKGKREENTISHQMRVIKI